LLQNYNYSKLRGKSLVCFGGSEGIGKAICDLAIKNNAKVYAFSRSTTNTDVKNETDIESSLQIVAKAEGKIDYIINTAGLLELSQFHTLDIKEIDNQINTNYRGSIMIAHFAYPYLKVSRGGLLMFTSSSYTYGRPLYGLYSSSKAAIVNFTQSLAQEWTECGIQVNCINPERTKTQMRIRNFGIEDESKLLDPIKVAEVSLATLCSSFTGQVLDVRNNSEV
jgi:2-C-methyl-D-erythritol 4-phosphate cytidylyltransferase